MDIKAIRGATTVDLDTKEDIENASIELFSNILHQNSINTNDIVYVHISTTADLKSYYPATALRLNGCNVPLFSSQEPSITGSLAKCIRILCVIKTAVPVKHVYLRKALNLRASEGDRV